MIWLRRQRDDPVQYSYGKSEGWDPLLFSAKVQGLQELVQAMFDVILIRFAFVSIGAGGLGGSWFGEMERGWKPKMI